MELFYSNQDSWIEVDKESSEEWGLKEPCFSILAEFLDCEVNELKFAGPEEFASTVKNLSDEFSIRKVTEYIKEYNKFRDSVFQGNEMNVDLKKLLPVWSVSVYKYEDKEYIHLYETGYECIITK